MWSLTDGSEITHFAFVEDILSFAWSRNGRLLAISHPSGSICLVDVMDGFRTLAEKTTSKECGLIKFSPDCRILICVHSEIHSGNRCELFYFRVNVIEKEDCKFSLDVLPGEAYYYPMEFESCSGTGFLLGDPFFSLFGGGSFTLRPELVFVLNGQSVLRVSFGSKVIEMLHPVELMKDRDRFPTTAVKEVVFSLNGDTLYVVTDHLATHTTLTAWDISSGRSKAEKNVGFNSSVGFVGFLVAIRAGVLFRTRTSTLELWNFELSECIRSWTDIGDIKRVIPISEERVACEVWNSRQVIILDTTSGDIVSTITIRGIFVACNSKCQMITKGIIRNELQMQCGEHVLWKISKPFETIPFLLCNTFSPSEQYCVVSGKPESDFGRDVSLYVLDAASGRTLHMLCISHSLLIFKPHCKFVSNEECVVSIYDESRGYCLRLFNVKSGDLLSEITMESEVCSLAACPRKRLFAIGFKDSEDGFRLLQVKLPQDKTAGRTKCELLLRTR